jgi:hypothetical protein
MKKLTNRLSKWIGKHIRKSQNDGLHLAETILDKGYHRSVIMDSIPYPVGVKPDKPPPPPQPPSKRIINEDVRLPSISTLTLPIVNHISFIHNRETTVTLPSAPAEGQTVAIIVDDKPVCVRAANTISGLSEDMLLTQHNQVVGFIFNGESWMPLSMVDNGIPIELTDENEIECYIDRIGL